MRKIFSTRSRIRNEEDRYGGAREREEKVISHGVIKKALANSMFPRNDFHCALATMTYALVGCAASILHDSYFRPCLNKAESGPVPAMHRRRDWATINTIMPQIFSACLRFNKISRLRKMAREGNFERVAKLLEIA